MPVDARGSRETYVLDQRGGNVALDLQVLDQHLARLMDTALEGTGISSTLYAVYAQLALGEHTPGQLCEVLGIRPTTLSSHLAVMESRGDCTRTRSETDGRSRVVALTRAGDRAWHDARDRVRRAVQAVNRRLGGGAAVDALRVELGRLDQAIQASTTSLAR